MGADYYTCQNCNVGYRDDDNYCCYCECGGNFCTKNCGKLENYNHKYDDDSYRIDKNNPITCVLCRKEKYTDYILLQSIYKHYNLTKEDVINIWKNQKED